MSSPTKPKSASPFRYFNSSPEVIRLIVMTYVHFPLSLRNVEDLLAKRASISATRPWGTGGARLGRCLPPIFAGSG
jgi:hypothetical protein